MSLTYLPRSLIISLVAVFLSLLLRRGFISSGSRGRLCFWIMILSMLLIPPIVIGYAYSIFSFRLVPFPVLSEIFYSIITMFHFMPIAFIALYFTPNPWTPESIFCHKLARTRKSAWRRRLSAFLLFLRSSGRGAVVAFSLVFIFVFNEFEIASLLNVKHWTVNLFDAHAQGLPFLESIKYCATPTFLALLAVGAVIFIWDGNEASVTAPEIQELKQSQISLLASWVILFLGFVLVMIFPFTAIVKNAIKGFPLLFQDFWMHREILASLGFAFATSICVLSIIAVLSYSTKNLFQSRKRQVFAIAVLTPCFIGALPLALTTLGIFQLPILNVIYDTPLPLATTLTLLFFPYAFALFIFFQLVTPNSAIHSAKLLMRNPNSRKKALELLWASRSRKQFVIFFLVFCWAYFELTAAAILTPPGMTTIFARLYNLMHYGQSEKLSATLCAALIAPLLIFIITTPIFKKVTCAIYD